MYPGVFTVDVLPGQLMGGVRADALQVALGILDNGGGLRRLADQVLDDHHRLEQARPQSLEATPNCVSPHPVRRNVDHDNLL